MEERLNQLKMELAQDKSKRKYNRLNNYWQFSVRVNKKFSTKKNSTQGGTIWSRAQPGPVGNYGKAVLKSAEKRNEEDSITYKVKKRLKTREF